MSLWQLSLHRTVPTEIVATPVKARLGSWDAGQDKTYWVAGTPDVSRIIPNVKKIVNLKKIRKGYFLTTDWFCLILWQVADFVMHHIPTLNYSKQQRNWYQNLICFWVQCFLLSYYFGERLNKTWPRLPPELSGNWSNADAEPDTRLACVCIAPLTSALFMLSEGWYFIYLLSLWAGNFSDIPVFRM